VLEQRPKGSLRLPFATARIVLAYGIGTAATVWLIQRLASFI